MPEHPMLFDLASVRGLLDGTKTQTRRLVKPQPTEPLRPMMNVLAREVYWCHDDGPPDLSHGELEYRDGTMRPIAPQKVRSWRCPHPVGTRLWVREAWARVPATAYRFSGPIPHCLSPDGHSWAVYREGWERSQPGPWRPSIHMPRWASRLTLEVVSVKLERVNAISPGDAQAEGICEPCHGCNPGVCQQPGPVCTVFLYSQVLGFGRRWDEIHGPGAWDEGEWVWVYGLRRVKPLFDLPAAPARRELPQAALALE